VKVKANKMTQTSFANNNKKRALMTDAAYPNDQNEFQSYEELFNGL